MPFINGWILQIWQYGGSTASEHTLDDAIATALQYGAVGIAPKVLDGLTWMGHVQRGAPDAPLSVNDVANHAARCQDAGLMYLPWVNPLHGSREYLNGQAALYATVGNVAGSLTWDSEPYDQFWGANRPVGDAFAMLEEFRRIAPSCFNIWQPDPRPGRLAELRPDEWAQHMNAYAPQSYWSDFGTSAAFEIDRAADQAAAFGIAECAPTIPANTDPANVPAALQRMAERGVSGCLAWRMGTLTDGHLGWLRDLAGTGHQPAPPPEPPDACAEIQAEYDHLHAQLEAWRDAKPFRAVTKKKLKALLA